MAQKPLSDLQGLLQWRCIGPFRGGRVVAVTGDTQDKATFYFGACAGGVWKTTDAGTYWQCVSDGFFNTSSIGALASCDSDPNVLYAGTGESTIRIDVSHGDGVYKSCDAGRSWQHLGLEDSRHIGKIRVHPHNPDLVYVAALGHAFGKNKTRGVYRSRDGGANWEQVLFRSDKAGAVDLSLDPHNPRILYATTWEAYRNFWQISSGGEDSSLYRSSDGGDTWTELRHNPGLPAGLLGKMGVAASPAQAGRVWALIENKDKGGLYRSDDYGDTWQCVSEDQRLISRAWYYMHLTPDPQDPDTLYINNLSLWKSSDGGVSFQEIATPHGDNHDLWIDPNDPQRMVQGNDGGACVSLNGGATWSSIYNQPTAQFYHLDVDNRQPYRVYGTQQDNSSVAVPSRSPNQSISWSDCYCAGTGESGYIAVNPDNPDIVFVGAIGSSPGGGNSLQRYDHRSKQVRLVTTWPEGMGGHGASEHRYRFAWTYPIFFSPHDANTLYIAGNQVFKTQNEGQSWQVISPDLTRADPDTLQPTGGPINRDAVGAETYATVFALAESPHEPGVLWAGSDDGLLHISRDGGQNWQNITPKNLPEWTLISMLEPSPHDPATCYMAATRYKLDDYQPYLYKSSNYGKSWSRIDKGLPRDTFCRAIREDPNCAGLLYVGTETGLFFSPDQGKHWHSLQLNLPVSPIYDLKVKHNDLVVATHGRAFWILDDLSPLYQLAQQPSKAEGWQLFAPRDSLRIMPQIFEGTIGKTEGKSYMATLGIVAAYIASTSPEGITNTHFLDTGSNPPKGVILRYALRDTDTPFTLRISNDDGQCIREFHSYHPETNDDASKDTAKLTVSKAHSGQHEDVRLPAKAGYNSFVWDMRHELLPKIIGSDVTAETKIQGAIVPPGRYTATLTQGEQQQSHSFNILPDPLAEASAEDLRLQYQLYCDITAKLSQTIASINRMRDLRQQLQQWAQRVEGELLERIQDLHAKILACESQLAVPDLRPGWPDNINAGVRLLAQLSGLIAIVSAGNYRPSDQAHEAFAHFATKIDEQEAHFQSYLDQDLAAINGAMREQALDNIVLRA